jgi:lipopolysaccharide/colanic/teichoic acid biosynthesis glycosyltransferase
VRPGIVGLWQICRSRKPGLDFQEWIRFDIQYTERQSWRLDLWIIWRAVLLIALRRKPKSEVVVSE